MKKQIDLFGNEITLQEATVKPVVKQEPKKQPPTKEKYGQNIRPYSSFKESATVTWIINK